MAENYGKMALSEEGETTGSALGNGIRQLFKTFDNSRQMEQSSQYGRDNQYDYDSTKTGIYKSFFGGDRDDD